MNLACILSLVVRLVLGFQLLLGGWHKATAFEWWRDLVVQMDVFPVASTGFLAGVLPGVELVLGLTLVVGFRQRASAILATGVFAGFATIMILLVQKDAALMCGCFGPGSDYPADWNHVINNVALLLCSLTLLFLPAHKLSIKN